MYKVTISKKGSYERIVLKYRSKRDAFIVIEDMLTGDLGNNYEYKIEFEEEGEE